MDLEFKASLVYGFAAGFYGILLVCKGAVWFLDLLSLSYLSGIMGN